MKKFKEKGFTLIELIAVLVIMAIIALIATPLVMSIIRKARVSADRRSVDAYGRSIELAITGYLLDNGTFPTSIEQLTIEYSGDEVVCSTIMLNSDSSVYLAGCRVAGRVVNYEYGEDKRPLPTYQVGDQVTYNGVNYYVIEDSGLDKKNVILLKADRFSSEEIQTYSAGTGAQTNGSGGMQYGPTSSYSTSYMKTTVDAWASEKVGNGLQEARLLTLDDIVEKFGFEYYEVGTDSLAPRYRKTELTPNWLYDENYWYWMMVSLNDSSSRVWYVDTYGDLEHSPSDNEYGSVRPVIVLSKSVLR